MSAAVTDQHNGGKISGNDNRGCQEHSSQDECEPHHYGEGHHCSQEHGPQAGWQHCS